VCVFQVGFMCVCVFRICVFCVCVCVCVCVTVHVLFKCNSKVYTHLYAHAHRYYTHTHYSLHTYYTHSTSTYTHTMYCTVATFKYNTHKKESSAVKNLAYSSTHTARRGTPHTADEAGGPVTRWGA